MINIPKNLSNKHSFKIKKQQFLFVEYTAVHESMHNDVLLSDSAIVYIIQGTKVITTPNSTIKISENQLFMIPRGRYIMEEYLPANGYFRSIMLFFNQHLLLEILHSLSREIRIEQKYDVPIHIINCTPQLILYFESLLHINFEKDHFGFNKQLLSHKIHELIYLLLSSHASRNQIIDLLYKTLKNTDQKYPISKVLQEYLFHRLSIESMAQLCNMSVSTFKREFRNQYNSTPMQWIMNKKLEKAYVLVKTTNKLITDIAHECGFENYIHFSRQFKAKYGNSAKEIRALL